MVTQYTTQQKSRNLILSTWKLLANCFVLVWENNPAALIITTWDLEGVWVQDPGAAEVRCGGYWCHHCLISQEPRYVSGEDCQKSSISSFFAWRNELLEPIFPEDEEEGEWGGQGTGDRKMPYGHGSGTSTRIQKLKSDCYRCRPDNDTYC